MSLTKKQIAACHRLYRCGALTQFGPGDMIARGFADVGFEEFFVSYDGTLLSVPAGDRSNLDEGERHAFFLLPTVDDIIGEIYALGGVVERIEKLPEPLGWRVAVSSLVVGVKTLESPSLFDGLARALGFLVGIEPFEPSEAPLISVPAHGTAV